MDDHESPLLSKESSLSSSLSSVVASSFKWILKVVMSVIFVAWVVFLVMYPGKLGDGILTSWRAVSSNTLFGTTGFTFLLIFRQKKSLKIVTSFSFSYSNFPNNICRKHVFDFQWSDSCYLGLSFSLSDHLWRRAGVH